MTSRVHPRPESPAKESNPSRNVHSIDSYSIQKLLELDDYTQQTSLRRVVFVLAMTPLPGLVGALLPTFIPLDNISTTPTASFAAHVMVMQVVVNFGAILPALVTTQIPRDAYSLREVAAVSLISAVMTTGSIFGIATVWRYPIPFQMVSTIPMWSLTYAGAHVVVLRSKLWRHPALRRGIQLYGPPFIVQVCQAGLYPGFSVLFDRSSTTIKILLTVCFPFVKYAMKKSLHRISHGLLDYSGEVAVSGVEICASLYQSILMQTTSSAAAMATIMGLDVLMGILAIKLLMDKKTHVPRNELVSRAVRLLRSELKTSSSHGNGSTLNQSFETRQPEFALRTDSKATQDERLVIRQALEFANAAEAVLLVEYFEVMIPVANCIFLAVAAHLPSARFNTRLAPFYYSPHTLGEAVISTLLYSSLQGLSCVVMHFVMKYRYGLSAAYHLSFVMERHLLSIQGKLLAWLSVILHFSVIHYGADFTFRFKYDYRPLRPDT
ncbi:hypothetical protein PINS_up011776 [Pythium insidiosum]|nr:hypothetical protein PINS_up011776 [Pythium insidiosum]